MATNSKSSQRPFWWSVAKLKFGTSSMRKTAAIEIWRDARAIKPLVSALGDRDMSVREKVAERLGWIGDDRGITPLIEALGDPETGVRAAAAVSLGKIGNERGIAPLTSALQDSCAGVREAAASSLGLICDSRAIESLIPMVGDEEHSVRRAAHSALERLELPIERHIAALEDRSALVRFWALSELGRNCSNNNMGNSVVDTLVGTLTDPDSGVRQRSAELLGESGNQRAFDGLLSALAESVGSLSVLKSVAEALGKLGDERAVGSLIPLVDHESYGVSAAAFSALLSIKVSLDSAEPLVAATEHENSSLRSWAIQALAAIGDARAVPPLIKELGEQSYGDSFSQSLRLVKTLVKFGARRAVNPIIASLVQREFLWDEPWDDGGEDGKYWRQSGMYERELDDREEADQYRCAVTTCLEDILGEETAECIALELKKFPLNELICKVIESFAKHSWSPSNVEQRIIRLVSASNRKGAEFLAAAESAKLELSRLLDEEGLEPVVALLTDEGTHRDLRQWAVDIGLGNSARSVEPLVHALDDDDFGVRRAAIVSLGNTGSKRAVPALIACCASADMRQFSAKEFAAAFGKIGDVRAFESLLQILEEDMSDSTARHSSAEALANLGDRRGVAPLERMLRQCGETYTPPEGYPEFRHSLARLLEQVCSVLEESELQELASINVDWSVVSGYGCGAPGTTWRKESLDCTEIKQLARQELIRRGIKA